jgi:peptide/nickel transport system substrate-binding protein
MAREVDRRNFLGLGATLAGAGLLAACAGNSASVSATAKGSASGSPVRGGDLTYLDYEAPYSFNFANLGYWQNQGIANNVLDRLVFVTPDAKAIRPWLATSWTVSKDGLAYTFTIRRGVTYSDGTVLDAENVKQNLEFQAFGDNEGNIPNSNFPAVKSVTADNATGTVVVRLAMENYIIDQGYALPLTERTQTFAAQADVHGFSDTQSSPWFYLTWKA